MMTPSRRNLPYYEIGCDDDYVHPKTLPPWPPVEKSRLGGTGITPREAAVNAVVKGLVDCGVLSSRSGRESAQNSRPMGCIWYLVDSLNDLPEEKRCLQGEIRSTADIIKAIPHFRPFLEQVELLREGCFWGINEAGQLVMGDRVGRFGSQQKGFSYNRSRALGGLTVGFMDSESQEPRVDSKGRFYAGPDGDLRLRGDPNRLIPAARVLFTTGLPTPQDYIASSSAAALRRDCVHRFWVENGEHPETLQYVQASLVGPFVALGGFAPPPQSDDPSVFGFHRVLRVNLQFQ